MSQPAQTSESTPKAKVVALHSYRNAARLRGMTAPSQASALQPTVVTQAPPACGQTIDRLEQLEQHIHQHQSDVLHPEWLNEYIDLGLELAEQAGQRDLLPLQESWLKRIYKTLRDAAFNLQCHESWRQQCLDFLYQPFFALQHFYRAQPDGRQRVRLLFKDLSMISRYVV